MLFQERWEEECFYEFEVEQRMTYRSVWEKVAVGSACVGLQKGKYVIKCSKYHLDRKVKTHGKAQKLRC